MLIFYGVNLFSRHDTETPKRVRIVTALTNSDPSYPPHIDEIIALYFYQNVHTEKIQ